MVKFKPGVRVSDFTKPEVMLMLQTLSDTAPADYTVTITSGNDSKHRGRGHYEGRAFDVRVFDFPGFHESSIENEIPQTVILNWIDSMREVLPTDKYKILYAIKGHFNHIHIEYIG